MSYIFPQKIKSVLFDMDGVLYDSMKHHATTWVDAFKQYNINFPEKEAYLNEGSTGDATIKRAVKQIENREATTSEIEGIYDEKTRLMHQLPPAEIIPGMQKLMQELRKEGIKIIIVTGSRQPVLLDRLKHDFHVEKEDIVSGWDVTHGKPHPEPYLTALKKARSSAEETVVIENAPLGVEAATAAGIYTIAINTGPLDAETLIKAGANKVFITADEIGEFLQEKVSK
ncbi:HAD family hydrolase [Marinilabilia rubra]|uniref:Beta-phosphoglucomutase n=1 Tax=Marinilabilia rubra TaxID=2162893 RepID=A0A2U2B4X3_9BACT|nr:HAD family phosphatase [Marinilabilia rubra]PWD98103.1 beta-phosphoglucomutase [Marinilabilia rubra]